MVRDHVTEIINCCRQAINELSKKKVAAVAPVGNQEGFLDYCSKILQELTSNSKQYKSIKWWSKEVVIKTLTMIASIDMARGSSKIQDSATVKVRLVFIYYTLIYI